MWSGEGAFDAGSIVVEILFEMKVRVGTGMFSPNRSEILS